MSRLSYWVDGSTGAVWLASMVRAAPSLPLGGLVWDRSIIIFSVSGPCPKSLYLMQ